MLVSGRLDGSIVVSMVPGIPEHETSSQVDMKSLFDALKHREMEFVYIKNDSFLIMHMLVFEHTGGIFPMEDSLLHLIGAQNFLHCFIKRGVLLSYS